MAISAALSNALTGLQVTQTSLDVLSRNVSNAGTTGYHRQSLNLVDQGSGSNSLVRSTGVVRAFSAALQKQYNTGVSDAAYASTRADILGQLQTFFGMPGDASSLDTLYSDFTSALEAVATSPDSYAARADLVSKAQALADGLNTLSSDVQNLRQTAEGQMATEVGGINDALSELATINGKLIDTTLDSATRANLMDRRDLLVASVAESIDVTATYRDNGTVSLMTRSGVGLVDTSAARFEFTSAGQLSPQALYDTNAAESGVGDLRVVTAAGLSLDVVGQDVVRSGTLGALIELRDSTLVDTQEQLDEIAAALATALSTINQDSTAVTSGPAAGFEMDLGDVQPGNSVTLTYIEGATTKSVQILRVDDTSKLPMDYMDANGTRVLGLDFSGGIGAVATALQTALGPGLSISNPSGDVLQVLDDGLAGTTDVSAMSARVTVPGMQGSGLGLQLFVDAGSGAFTNSLDGATQKLGFASRIAVNPAILSNNSLVVQYDATSSLGDDARAVYLRDQLESLRFVGTSAANSGGSSFRLSGTVSDLIAQTLNYQGGVAQTAERQADGAGSTLETMQTRMEAEYGVDIDTEMARLMELQNAYSANARVISAVQDLLDALMQI